MESITTTDQLPSEAGFASDHPLCGKMRDWMGNDLNVLVQKIRAADWLTDNVPFVSIPLRNHITKQYYRLLAPLRTKFKEFVTTHKTSKADAIQALYGVLCPNRRGDIYMFLSRPDAFPPAVRAARTAHFLIRQVFESDFKPNVDFDALGQSVPPNIRIPDQEFLRQIHDAASVRFDPWNREGRPIRTCDLKMIMYWEELSPEVRIYARRLFKVLNDYINTQIQAEVSSMPGFYPAVAPYFVPFMFFAPFGFFGLVYYFSGSFDLAFLPSIVLFFASVYLAQRVTGEYDGPIRFRIDDEPLSEHLPKIVSFLEATEKRESDRRQPPIPATPARPVAEPLGVDHPRPVETSTPHTINIHRTAGEIAWDETIRMITHKFWQNFGKIFIFFVIVLIVIWWLINR